jgi:1-deoxy-D-xylulose-5-phosphate reductoisomerase
VKRVAVLGSTGSIGVSTLDVVARHPDRFVVTALAAGHRREPLLEQCPSCNRIIYFQPPQQATKVD